MCTHVAHSFAVRALLTLGGFYSKESRLMRAAQRLYTAVTEQAACSQFLSGASERPGEGRLMMACPHSVIAARSSCRVRWLRGAGRAPTNGPVRALPFYAPAPCARCAVCAHMGICRQASAACGNVLPCCHDRCCLQPWASPPSSSRRPARCACLCYLPPCQPH